MHTHSHTDIYLKRILSFDWQTSKIQKNSRIWVFYILTVTKLSLWESINFSNQLNYPKSNWNIFKHFSLCLSLRNSTLKWQRSPAVWVSRCARQTVAHSVIMFVLWYASQRSAMGAYSQATRSLQSTGRHCHRSATKKLWHCFAGADPMCSCGSTGTLLRHQYPHFRQLSPTIRTVLPRLAWGTYCPRIEIESTASNNDFSLLSHGRSKFTRPTRKKIQK